MIRHIWILIAKKLSGEATEEELRELEQFFNESGSNSPLETLEHVWKQTSAPKTNTDEDLEAKWTAFDAQLDILDQQENPEPATEPARTGIIRPLLKYLGYAAIFALSMSTVYLLMKPQKPDQGTTAVVAPANGVSKITLPDGSNVWLNSGSKITYRNNDENKCREVHLSGEAYFDVVKDPTHPFTVTTSSFKITVLGTAFNVRSYAKGKTSEATLVRGRIELSLNKSPERKYVLKPAEKFTINQAPEPTLTGNAAPAANGENEFASVELKKIHEYAVEGMPSEVLWMKSVIDFDNTDFEDVAKLMEHKYNVTIQFKDDDIKKLKFTGKFKNESIETAMKELQVTVDFHYKIDKDQVLVY